MTPRLLHGTGVAAAAFALFALAAPVGAHHSVAGAYDTTKGITVTGTVTKIDWTNPHAWLFIESHDGSGKPVAWSVEGYSTRVLERNGWTRDETVKVGDVITVSGWRARDGTPIAYVQTVTLRDGKKLNFGAAVGAAPTTP